MVPVYIIDVDSWFEVVSVHVYCQTFTGSSVELYDALLTIATTSSYPTVQLDHLPIVRFVHKCGLGDFVGILFFSN